MTGDAIRIRLRRLIAASLAGTMLATSLPGYAQVSRLSLPDVPLLPLPIKPNVIFTFDNSHTMSYPWMSNLLLPQTRGNPLEEPGRAWPRVDNSNVKRQSTGLAIANDPSIYSSSVNLLYYNPEIRYVPGLDPDGNPMPAAGGGVYTPTYMPNEPYRQRFGGPSGPDADSTNLTSYCTSSTAQGGYPGGAIALTALDHERPRGQPFTWDNVGSLTATDGGALLKVSQPPARSGLGRAENLSKVGVNVGLEAGTYCVWNLADRDNADGLRVKLDSSIVAMFSFYYRYDPQQPGCPATATEPERLRNKNCFARVDILHPKATGASDYPGGPARTDCNPMPGNPGQRSCTYEQEIRNFANWWSYYRTRSLAMKTAIGRAIHQLPADAPYRIGLNTIVTPDELFNDATTEAANSFQWVTPRDWSTAQRKKFLTALYAAGSSRYGSATGTKENTLASVKVGEYLARGPDDGFACSGNTHILLTDGVSIAPAAGAMRALDPKVPYAGPDDADYDKETGNPNPYVDRSIAAVDVRGKAGALSDAAMFFFSKNLRAEGASGTPVTDFRRVRTSVVGVGFQGFKPYTFNYDANPGPTSFLTQIAQGNDFWDPLSSSSYILPGDAARKDEFTRFPWKSAIDDHWHAAINGRGIYYNFPLIDGEAWRRALPTVLEVADSATSISKPGSTVSRLDIDGSTFAYVPTYSPGVWTGDVVRRPVNPATGEDTVAPGWSAKQLLDRQVVEAGGTGWATQRRIFTPVLASAAGPSYRINAAQPFRWDRLSMTQRTRVIDSARWNDLPAQAKARLGNSTAMGEKVLAFLRGNREHEIGRGGLNVFRYRTTVLGSIINSAVAYVGEPAGRSTDVGYAEFMEQRKNRGAMVYVGANDGMLHAFDAVSGRERWAFVPTTVFLDNDPDPASDSGIGSQAVANEPDGSRKFRPYAYVDSTPVVADVDFACAGTACPEAGGGGYAPQWRTILAGGLGKGGRSVYALDVTEGAADDGLTEEQIGPARFLWEYANEKMGFTFGEPIVAKTARWGWVVMIPSGYNNADGIGYVFVLNAKTGERIATLTTGEGSAAAPIGLAKIAGYASKLRNQEVDAVYAGDLQGNVWRWDLAGNTATGDLRGTKIAKLAGPGGKSQPVTTRPRVEVDDKGRRYVFVGTGKLLEVSDIDSTDVQTMYAIRDGDSQSPALTAAVNRSNLTAASASDVNGVTAPAGWYIDLTAGEQILVEPRFGFGSIFFASAKPDKTDPCSTNTTARLFGRSAVDAKSVLLDPSNSGSGGTVSASVVFKGNLSKVDAVLAGATPSLRAIDSQGVARQVRVKTEVVGANRGRIAWREISTK